MSCQRSSSAATETQHPDLYHCTSFPHGLLGIDPSRVSEGCTVQLGVMVEGELRSRVDTSLARRSGQPIEGTYDVLQITYVISWPDSSAPGRCCILQQ